LHDGDAVFGEGHHRFFASKKIDPARRDAAAKQACDPVFFELVEDSESGRVVQASSL
jgi:hypothetical protein